MILFTENSYLKLPPILFSHQNPQFAPNPALVYLNTPLLEKFNIKGANISKQKWAEALSGNKVLENSIPVSLAYAGHQFGHFVPQLGDGRAVLLGCIQDKNNSLFDVQLKGSGRTKFSRQGDGRATLGSVIREYLISEAMHYLGVSSTRSLAIVTTGETIRREKQLAGAVLTRIASSHIRIGTFQYLAYQNEYESLKQLTKYCLQRHYPNAKKSHHPAITLLQEVLHSQAKLISNWMSLGFIHGVMNTDNTSISGETIDYGPCAFMDEYDPDTVFSSIDHLKRYSFQNQADALHWNLARFAETLLPLIDKNISEATEQVNEILQQFQLVFQNYWLQIMSKKIGIFEHHIQQDENLKIVKELLEIMHHSKSDYTNTFYNVSYILLDNSKLEDLNFLLKQQRFQNWILQWKSRLSKQTQTLQESVALMNATNPAYIPRNHEVEKVIQASTMHNDFQPFYQLLKVISNPYPFERPISFSEYTKPPKEHERVQETFCGT